MYLIWNFYFYYLLKIYLEYYYLSFYCNFIQLFIGRTQDEFLGSIYIIRASYKINDVSYFFLK